MPWWWCFFLAPSVRGGDGGRIVASAKPQVRLAGVAGLLLPGSYNPGPVVTTAGRRGPDPHRMRDPGRTTAASTMTRSVRRSRAAGGRRPRPERHPGPSPRRSGHTWSPTGATATRPAARCCVGTGSLTPSPSTLIGRRLRRGETPGWPTAAGGSGRQQHDHPFSSAPFGRRPAGGRARRPPVADARPGMGAGPGPRP